MPVKNLPQIAHRKPFIPNIRMYTISPTIIHMTIVKSASGKKVNKNAREKS